jgi:hypothetical protein
MLTSLLATTISVTVSSLSSLTTGNLLTVLPVPRVAGFYSIKVTAVL